MATAVQSSKKSTNWVTETTLNEINANHQMSKVNPREDVNKTNYM